jgi:hypothetical protein
MKARHLLFALIGFFSSLPASAQNETRVIAKAGDIVESQNGTVTINRLLTDTGGLVTPFVSDRGHTSFNALAGGRAVVIQREPDGQMRVIAGVGDDLGGGVTLSSVGAPAINNFGRVVFFGRVSGTGVTTANDTGFVATLPQTPGEPSGPPRIFLREGMSLPDGAQVATFAGVIISKDSDDRWFTAQSQLIGNGITYANDRAIVGVVNGTAGGILLREGSTAPITGGAFNTPNFSVGPRGDTVYYSYLSGAGVDSSNNQGIWIDDPLNQNSLLLVARTGVAAPGAATPSRLTALWSGTSTPQMNAVRTVAFLGTYSTPTGVIGGALYVSREGDRTLQPLFASGSTAQGVTVAGPYSPYNQRTFYLTDSGRVFSWVLLTGPGVNSGNNLGLAVHDQAGSRLILRAGQPFPELGSGVTLSVASLGAFTRVNRRGDCALWVKFQGPGITPDNDDAMVTYVNDQLRVVARKGQVIPNSGGATIGELAAPPQIFMNNRGELVFMVRAIGGDLPIGGQWAFVSVNAAGELGLIAIANRTFQLADGTITRVQGFGYESSPLADDGRFVFSGTVTLPGLGTEAVFETTIDSAVQPPPLCPADFNSDGSATVQDIFDFLTLWFVQGMGADFNRDSTVTVQDLFDFLNVWFGGCP